MNATMNAILCPFQFQINREQLPQHLQINPNTYQMKQTSLRKLVSSPADGKGYADESIYKTKRKT
jgi:hypothetical protein